MLPLCKKRIVLKFNVQNLKKKKNQHYVILLDFTDCEVLY